MRALSVEAYSLGERRGFARARRPSGTQNTRRAASAATRRIVVGAHGASGRREDCECCKTTHN